MKDISLKLRKGKNSTPPETYLLFLLFACHGVLRDGVQWIVCNEYDKKDKFYGMCNIEIKLRNWAEIYPNAYIVGIFACCR